ncbi:hypothetical protein D3C79_725570 [compost metagenome]
MAELVGALLGDGRDHVDRAFPLQALDHFLDPLVALVVHDHVGLVQHQPALTLGQRRAEAGQLVDDDFGGIGRAAFVQRRHVHQVQQHAGTRQVLEEADTQAGTVGSAFDQAGDVGDDEALPAVDADHAQVWHQGSERVVGDFRLGGRDRTDEGTLASVRQAQQADVGQHLHFHLQVTLLTRFAWGGLARRTVGARLETGVAQPVPATLRDHQLLAGGNQVTDHFLRGSIDHGGADRHAQEQVFTLLTGAVGATAVGATLGFMVTGVAVVDQGVQVFVGNHVHRATVTAVTAVRAAVLDELLATEAHATVATVTGLDPNGYFVNKLH